MLNQSRIMTQNDTNNVVEVKVVPFWDKPSTRICILLGLILVIAIYFGYKNSDYAYSKQICESSVRYVPAGESYGSRFGLESETSTVNVYRYDFRSFETKREAVAYCINSRK